MSNSAISASGGTYAASGSSSSNSSSTLALSSTDFLSLIIKELANQDFNNTTDTTDMVNQMAQFSMVNAIEEMSTYSKSGYAMSLLGKTITTSDGTMGTCDAVSLSDGDYAIDIGGTTFSLSDIQSVEQAVDTGSDTTTDTTTVDPTNYSVSASSVTSSGANISWEVPTDNTTTADGLTYTVYYTPYDSSNSFNTVSAVSAGTMAGSKGQTGTSATLANLQSGSNYLVNVVVTDADGNQSVYDPITIRTQSA